jgi:ketosteroid isomerase-like protein
MTDIVEDFYGAFARKDHATMARCYADDATFSDPVFPRLDAEHARGMWRMFCQPGNDLRIDLASHDVQGKVARGRWIAHYTFQATGRPVVNVIDATFDLENGKIVRHVDRFDFWKWSRQALGAPGLLLGWTPIVQNKVRRVAAARLEEFLARAT